ncbi:MAG: type IV pilin-like G/H family protein [Rivularia sp. T60_A2020_040]|nr:type IV pilin-like G/H family protein [Rivularia sp. T60_A2020_040]
MKTELKAKFLQNILRNKKEDEGFTLIELLVVIIIIGILSAIALPSFLNQANKAKQSEAKTIAGSMNRTQQAYYLENNEFADNAKFAKLGLGVKTETGNYKYTIGDGGTGKTVATNQAQPLLATAPIKAYIGGVAIKADAATSESNTLAVLCEAKLARNATGAATGTEKATDAACPNTYELVK